MDFVTITADDLNKLREALEIISRLDNHGERAITLTLYGLTSDPQVIAAVKDAVAQDAEIQEEDVKIAGEVAVAIEMSGDILYYLTGSGLKLDTEEVAFTKGGGNGIDTIQMTWSSVKAKVNVSSFSTMAISRDSWDANTFLRQYGNKAQAPAATPAAPPSTDTDPVRRYQEDKKNEKPAAPGSPDIPKVTSSVDPRLVEEFLD